MSGPGRISKNDRTKSFVVVKRHDGLKVIESYWAPGYTPGHKETEKEALLYYSEKLVQEMTSIQVQYSQLDKLMQRTIAAETPSPPDRIFTAEPAAGMHNGEPEAQDRPYVDYVPKPRPVFAGEPDQEI